ncbi:HDOD domain-containing protein [Aquabacterium sp.]|uniref:HDOD domain-containing protein n=1 Tax=Aquabacterium sp. TaxID=1872578 RepID=UPI002C1EDA17|nr:HDOD domain-containing protein [Aquabacterium sp.]HSW08237.1 HDOD domain-containing protein [Aquabacterium sp.]
MSHVIDTPFIMQAPRDVAAWVNCFAQLEIPVLASTVAAVAELGMNEDAVDAHLLSDTLGDDPLMVLKLLRHVAARRSARATADAETVTAAVLMLGIPPFFHAFGDQASVEDRLAGQPEALAGWHAVLQRSHRAARFALGFAVHRMDHDATVIHEAALLHDFAEMLLWVHAPALALEIAARQLADPGLRSVDAQQAVLHVGLSDLQQALMKAWRLPELLVKISDDHASVSPQVRNVQLAIRLARHTARGWDNAALPDDIAEIATLLNMAHEPTLALLHEIDS